MDRLSVLSVAASVAQFIEFGVSLVSKSKEIYQSTNSMTIQQVEAVTAATRLTDLSQQIRNARHVERLGIRASSTDERAFTAIHWIPFIVLSWIEDSLFSGLETTNQDLFVIKSWSSR